jgi:hypothetical protein
MLKALTTRAFFVSRRTSIPQICAVDEHFVAESADFFKDTFVRFCLNVHMEGCAPALLRIGITPDEIEGLWVYAGDLYRYIVR